MAKEQLHPIDKEIIRSLENLKLSVTRAKIAKAINVHPETVSRHLDKLRRRNIVKCKPKGNRLMCKLEPGWRKKV